MDPETQEFLRNVDKVVGVMQRCLDIMKMVGVEVRMPALHLNLRGQCAGRAYFGAWAIRINPQALILDPEGTLDNTVPHEMAHLLAWYVSGSKISPHGPEWKRIMLLLGAAPRRCHNLQLKPARTVRQVDYQCACGPHPISITRHKRVVQGKRRYECTICGETLVCPAEISASNRGEVR